MEKLKIFSAGVARNLVSQTVERLKDTEPNMACEMDIGGSSYGINKFLAGEDYDVMILADSSCIDEQLSDFISGYFIWGGNEMVLMGPGASDRDWKDIVLSKNAEIRHTNPYNDPSGYYAVMAMTLADHVERGLSQKLFNHPNYKGLDRRQYENSTMEKRSDDHDVYMLVYRSLAVSRGEEYARLPREMNFGDPTMQDLYRKAVFGVDGGHVVHGSCILHAITIPDRTAHRDLAEAFAREFMAQRFGIYGFTSVQKAVGNWNIKPANMWDREAKYYSLMTLMEINGTNKQLDTIPLDSEDVVLDCGCGPGRIAIQASKRVKKVICLDSSEAMLEECRKNCENAGVTNVEFVLADWQEAESDPTIPEVDVVIQARGGGGPSSLSLLRKTARKYAVNIMWSDGAPCLPESRNKLFVDCYSQDAMEKHPELKPFRRMEPPKNHDGKIFGGRGPIQREGKMPMDSKGLTQYLKDHGIEYTLITVPEGWDRQFSSKEAAYDDLICLSRYPELVDMEKFRENVDSFLTKNEDGWYFFLPTSSDVIYYRTR